ncbi:NAD(P)/FAD-dependent oxidoreductase [Candidatus Izemoplasma sp. B36]|uniref:NAD(P)/FAD-dependent oxidoreductase n=1 Tax=Candidatus Izemoplasma sp. B36 TaxID=3242468 RepID=UPI003557EB9C
MYDAIVIGGGPAGATAAIYLQRFKKNVLLIMKDSGALGKTAHIDNYYGFVETITGPELLEKGINQAKRLGVEVIKDEVLGIDNFPDFNVKTINGEYQSKTVLLATGKNQVNLRVKGFNDFIGKGISYCAICDGFIYRNKKIGLVGNKEFMLEELEVLKNFSEDITIFTNGMDLSVELHDEKIVTEKITEIKGDEKINQVVTENSEFDVDVLFIAIGSPSASDFALRMGAFLDKNNIVVDESFMTNIPGLFAAGDCIGGLLQIVKATSDGAHAAIAMNKYLKNN